MMCPPLRVVATINEWKIGRFLGAKKWLSRESGLSNENARRRESAGISHDQKLKAICFPFFLSVKSSEIFLK